MALRLPIVDYGYGNGHNAKMASCRLSSPELQIASRLSFCGSFRDHLLASRLHKPLLLQQNAKEKPLLITAIVKRKKYYPLDAVIQRQKKLKLVTRIKDLLIKQAGMVMSLKHLGKYRRQLGLTGRRRVVALLKKYPSIFEVFEEGVGALYFRLTLEAEDQFLKEQKLKAELETVLVSKIRKLLMMSIDKTLLLSKLDHLKKDLGLPDDYRTNMIEKYPQFFKVVEIEGGLALELTCWDPELAISAWEKKMQSGPPADDTISGRPRRFPKIDLPRGHNLKRKDREVIRRFQDRPYVSPYADFTHLEPASLEAEKHSCAVVHELLTLTLEKRTLIDHLTHFRKDYKFSQKLYGMLIRHPELFYISLKGDRDSVFLREAYNGSELIDKDPLVLVKEELGQLVAKSGRDLKQGNNEDGGDEEDESDDVDEEDGWSDDEVMDDSLDDSDEDQEGKTGKAPAQRERELRRPLNIIRKEQAMAALASAPRDKW